MDTKNILPTDQHLSEKQLRLGYWFVTHKVQLKNGLIFFLLLVSTGLLLFTLYMLVSLFLIDDARHRALERDIAQNIVSPAAVKAALPRQLIVKPIEVFDGQAGTVDGVVEVTNPNKNFWATWTGQFISPNTTTTKKTVYILPGETKQMVDLGIESDTFLRGARYEMNSLTWHKVNNHEIQRYQAYAKAHLQFAIQNVLLTTSPSADGKSTISRVSFSVTNASAYSFWSVQFLVRLYRQTSLAAVNEVELQELKTGETRQVEVVWVQDLAAISKVEVVPAVNILDPSVFMAQPQAKGTP